MLGFFNVDEMLESAPSPMLTEWKAFTNLNPLGEWRADLRAGRIASVIANVNSVRSKAYSPLDFMPDFLARFKEPTKANPEELTQKLMAFAEAFGAKKKTPIKSKRSRNR